MKFKPQYKEWYKREFNGWQQNYGIMSWQKGANIEFVSNKTFAIGFLKHAWSGKVAIFKDNKLMDILDLYSQNMQIDFKYDVKNIDNKEHTYKIEVLGEKNNQSKGIEVWIDCIYEY
ncbi:hypothetical protein SAMN05443428_101226 [Caloramator quimbayensis]|uniref:Uncharacterized protein n=1 Tax=Caloramator quimbayensis TaxID=1147123 RepID=A0A1T4WH38_9CLOT|nr:hypothetical protein SAMN05443428_101226 [Caloramator quimbayensis]